MLFESEVTSEDSTCEEVPDELQKGLELTDPKITLYALTGWATPQTMHVTAKVGLYDIIMLIDSGSTHNFISSRMANMLRLPIVPTTEFSVWAANGETLTCTGNSEKVKILLQGVLILEPDVIIDTRW